MIDLDLKDWRILFELDLDSRQSLQSIGKKVGLSKEVVNYRIKKHLEKGAIKNFFVRIDSSRLGIVVFRSFLRLYNLSPEKEKELVDFIVSNEKVGWCVCVDGNWDLNFIYWADGINDFSEFWRGFLSKYGDFVEDKWISVFDRYIEFPKLFLLRGKKIGDIPSFACGRNKKIDLDQRDLRILSILSNNARTPTLDIAKKTGLSAKAVATRIKRLKREGVILGFGIGLGLEEIGFEYFKLHLRFKRFDKKRFEELLAFAKFQPNIIFTNELIGGDDLELDIYAEDTEKYHSLLNEIRYKFSDIIKDFESFKYFKELKHNMFPKKA